MATKVKAVKPVDVTGISAEQIAAIIAAATPAIESAMAEKKAAAKVETGRIKRLPGLNPLPITPDDIRNNVIGKGCFGLKFNGVSVQWSVVQTERGFRSRHVFGEVFGLAGWTAVSVDELEGATNAFVLEGANEIVSDAMRKAIAECQKTGRVFVQKPKK